MRDAPRVFFVHVMRTGGGTLGGMLRASFDAGAVFPDPTIDLDMAKANLEIPYVLNLSRERRRSIRVYAGHFPFFVSNLLDPDLLTTTIIREPVQRTISYLQVKLEEANHALSAEDLYTYPGLNDAAMRNFQTRQFALTRDDGAHRALHALEIDDERLALAKANLAKIDVLGLHETFEEYLTAAESRFGWNLRPQPRWHVSEPVVISDSLRDRIAADNAADLALYEYAVALCDKRRVDVNQPSVDRAGSDARPG